MQKSHYDVEYITSYSLYTIYRLAYTAKLILSCSEDCQPIHLQVLFLLFSDTELIIWV